MKAPDDRDTATITTGLDLSMIGNRAIAARPRFGDSANAPGRYSGEPGREFPMRTFWCIEAIASVARRGEAWALFENVLARRNHLGRPPEDIAPGTPWGNFPWTCCQAGLTSAATRLTRSSEEGTWHVS
jgi:GH15 family glucan-1,4-alpha-glucosidase